MYSVRPNFFLRTLYPSSIWRIGARPGFSPLGGDKRGGAIFLSFDDGPIPEVTPWVLSQLKKHNALATFFCIGANIEKHPDIFRQIISEGHAVGNHTYDHVNGWKTKTERYLENVEKSAALMANEKWLMANVHQPSTINHQPLFRPPYGRMKRSQYSLLKSQYSVVMWDVLSGDFDQSISEEKCLKNVLTKTREGSIVVFHDSIKAKKNLYHALPKFLEYFSEKGFVFEGLDTAVGCLSPAGGGRGRK